MGLLSFSNFIFVGWQAFFIQTSLVDGAYSYQMVSDGYLRPQYIPEFVIIPFIFYIAEDHSVVVRLQLLSLLSFNIYFSAFCVEKNEKLNRWRPWEKRQSHNYGDRCERKTNDTFSNPPDLPIQLNSTQVCKSAAGCPVHWGGGEELW